MYCLGFLFFKATNEVIVCLSISHHMISLVSLVLFDFDFLFFFPKKLSIGIVYVCVFSSLYYLVFYRIDAKKI